MSEPTPLPEPATGAEPASSWRDLPLEQQVAAWEQTVPGSAERILRQVEADYEHRRRMDLVEVRFRIFGVGIASAGLTGIFWLAKYLIDHDAAGFGVGVFGASIAAFVGLLLRSDRLRR
ncbi:DUF2335 domain-containing protein [Streptomyces chartreusis]|uniref:DUF2335 domain-containing protein n=1 Tax=Streptomyces chartreusis TaxID=1969 RepID=UPI0034075F60